MNKSKLISPITAQVAKWITPPGAGQRFDVYFADAERDNGLPAGLLSRVAYQESRYDPDAYNPSGATGIMQIIPRWHPDVDATNPIESIYYGASYLRQNFERFGSWDKALAAYNWGPGNVNQAITSEGDNWLFVAPNETKDYVNAITADVGLV